MKPVLVCGSLAYDRIMDFAGNFSEHFMKDKLHSINVSFLVNPPKVAYGGCAGNIAYSLSLLSVRADILESAGNDFVEYEKRLAECGIGTKTIQIQNDAPTASAYIMTDASNNQICAFSEGASALPYEKPIDASWYGLAIAGTASIKTSLAVVRTCKAASVPYLFDPSQKLTAYAPEEIRECIEGAKGLLVNDYELALIIEKTGWSEADIVSKVGFLIVTLGAEGSRIVTKDGEELVLAVKVDAVIDPTGAGDAFRAGFIAGLVRALPLSTCASLGSAVAAYAVECYGTQNHRFTLPELAARYEGAYQESFPFTHASGTTK